MSDKKGPVPDFSAWKLLERKSFFCIPGQKDFGKKNPDEGDGENPFWYGYVCKYIDPSGNAEAFEFDFFGHGAALKFWGLIEEDYYNGLAVLRGKTWEYFPGRFYAVEISADILRRSGVPVGIRAALVRVMARDTEREVCGVTIPRDLLGLPPANKSPH